MDIIEITRQLGAAIQEDERYIRLQMAKEVNDNDKELQDLIGEFNLLRISANTEAGKKEKDEAKIEKINSDLRDCYAKIMSNKSMVEYNDAKNQVDDMMNRITSILTLCVNGEDPETCEASSCTGSCSTCGGCH